MKKLLVLFLAMLTLGVVFVNAASVGNMTDENTYISEDGKIYTYQDDKVYQLVDGELYEVVNGNEQSIIDIMKQKPGSEVPDAEIMGQANSLVGSTIGVALSVIIYVFFAMTAFTTACDLAYIGVPGVRSVLYDGAGSNSNANLHSSVMHDIAKSQMNRAGQAAMRGDMAGAARLQNQALGSEAEGQYRDQNWFGNRDRLNRAQSQSAGGAGGRCFISRELKSLVQQGQVNVTVTSNSYGGVVGQGKVQNSNSNILVTYLKRRAVSIVIIIAVFMLLVTSTVFTDFGLNLGKMIYQYAAKFLGF